MVIYLRANSLSSGLKNFADAMSVGRINVAMSPIKTVAMPSRIKIHRHPARPPIPSIFMIAKASRPPKAPDRDAKNKPEKKLNKNRRVAYPPHRKRRLSTEARAAYK